MEKGQESKQKRKTPLTTIAISQEYAKKLDEYLNGTGITRKEFVELSVDYFQRTGFDLRGEAFDLSPLEKVAGRLEQSAKIMERHNEGTEAVHLLLQAVREQTAKQLPAPELIAHAAEEKAKAEAKSEEQEREIARLRSENSALLEYKEKAYRELCRIRDEQKTIGKIKVNITDKKQIITSLRRGFRWGLLTFAHIKSKKKAISERIP